MHICLEPHTHFARALHLLIENPGGALRFLLRRFHNQLIMHLHDEGMYEHIWNNSKFIPN